MIRDKCPIFLTHSINPMRILDSTNKCPGFLEMSNHRLGNRVLARHRKVPGGKSTIRCSRKAVVPTGIEEEELVFATIRSLGKRTNSVETFGEGTIDKDGRTGKGKSSS